MYKSIDEIKTANVNRGHHFFANEWCMSIPDPTVYDGRYFITQDGIDLGEIQLPGKFTIREATDDGTIRTVGEYRQYESLAEAIKSVRGEG